MLHASCPTSDAAMSQKPPAAERSPSGGRWTSSLACQVASATWLRALLASGLLRAITAIAGTEHGP